MPPKGIDPQRELRAHQHAVVAKAATEFALTGALSVDTVCELTEVGVDYRAIFDACMSAPHYEPHVN